MTAESIFIFIIAILLFEYFLERILSFLNKKRWSDVLPDEVVGIYDSDKYRKQQNYERVNHKFGILTSSFSMVIMLCMFMFDMFDWVDDLCYGISENPILNALLFFGILLLASDILNIPFDLYDTFVIEEKFGFNKTTIKTFFLDKIKGWVVGGIIGGGLLALVIWLYGITQELFWIYAWIALSGFSIFMAMFYSNIIVPLFNKQTPLGEGPLRDAIEEFSRKTGFKLKNIYLIDGSKRSTKANAYFTGLGAKKRIVLFDTLINELDTQEIVAVLAHEVGHYRKKHTLGSMITSIIQSGILLYIFSLVVGNPLLSEALGADRTVFHLGLITFGILYSPFSLILGLLFNWISRKNEFAADRFASENYHPEMLASALVKLSVSSLSNLTPHPAYVFFHYSHPPLLERLKALGKQKSNS